MTTTEKIAFAEGQRVTVRHETGITETGTVVHHNVAAGVVDVHFDGDTYCTVPAFRVHTHKLHEIGRPECVGEGCEPDLPHFADPKAPVVVRPVVTFRRRVAR